MPKKCSSVDDAVKTLVLNAKEFESVARALSSFTHEEDDYIELRLSDKGVGIVNLGPWG